MKKIVLVMAIFLLIIPTSAYALGGYSNAISYLADLLGDTIEEVTTVTNRIEAQSPDIWGFEVNDDYIPQRGGIKVCKAENTVFVGFYLSPENMDFYNQQFSNGTRKPLGFEMVIIDHNKVFRRGYLSHYTFIPDTSDIQSVRYNEVYASDITLDRYTLCISDPTKLQVNKWYIVEFHFWHHEEFAHNATFEVQVQLVGNLYELKNDHNNLYDQYTSDVTDWVNRFFLMADNVGNPRDVNGNNYFNVRVPAGSKFHSFNFFGWPEGFDGHDRYLWNQDDNGQHNCDGDGISRPGQVCDYQPYSCGFGDDPWESGGPRVLGASIDAGSSYTYPAGGGSDATDSNPNADGDDVHITHHHIRPYNTGSWHERVDIDLDPGQSFDLHTQARVENRSSHDLEDVDIDYLVVKDKKDFDIPHSQRKRLDDDQVDIDEGDKENKTMARTRVSISSNFKTIKVDCLGRHNFTFPITQENINEREITLYFYIDVETEDGSDRDVSDEMKTDEFGKLEIHLPHFNSRFVASTTGGEASLVVDFINQSTGSPGAISIYHWDFGDGQTSLEASPSHTYSTSGVYTVTLITTSSWGEEKTATAIIEVVVSKGLSAPTNFRLTAP
ncbi:MAG: PKD domain-containing protein [Patescibacteria group bacterium]|nr:PKD domain-containing protein [Patescibacteria group bacterium]